MNLTIHIMKYIPLRHPEGLHGEESGYTLLSGVLPRQI
jgi:hypothetical protein